MTYHFWYRHFLTRLDAERAHQMALWGLRWLDRFPPARTLLRQTFNPDSRSVEGMGIRLLGYNFRHPLGLAGGFDKDGRYIRSLQSLGFSFIEVGTVTPQPQVGNPRPRLFRLLKDQALINRMGFPSSGMAEAFKNMQRFRAYHSSYPLGISIGKNKTTPLETAHEDYLRVMERLYTVGDFFVVNVSSPNTPDLRRLQTPEYLGNLLAVLQDKSKILAGINASPKPLVVKVAPDLTWEELGAIVQLCLNHRIGAIVATNTTIRREGLRGKHRDEQGGLSGAPLKARSTAIIRYIYEQSQGQLPIIGVGGIFGEDDVWEKMQAGASLVQSYTGFIYEGPRFVRKVIHGLRRHMGEENVSTLQEIIGAK